MIGIDTSILIALAIRTHAHRSATIDCTQREYNQGCRFILAPLVISEFLHVVSDTKQMNPAMTIAQATQWIESWIQSTHTLRVYGNDESNDLCFRWLRDYNLGRKRIHDTQLAAILHVHGVDRLLTHNAKDFRVFGVFNLIEP